MIALWFTILLTWSLSTNAEETRLCAKSCESSERCKKEYYIGSKKINFYSNFPLDQDNDCIEKVIFVVHGAERNALSRYKAVLDAAKSQGLEDRLLIVSPFFKTSDDVPTAKDYYWSSGWRQGNTSNNSGTQISSFAVADSIIHTVITNNRFRRLRNISVTGHSAGGQYTQMYALATSSPQEHPLMKYQFLVLNPSNYTYLNTLRPKPMQNGFFEEPMYWVGSLPQMKPLYLSVAGNCPRDYNNYKYGLEKRNSYANRLSRESLISQYLDRQTYYFLGELDTMVDDSLDTSCEAKLQGENRLVRGKNYYSFLSSYFSNNQHALRIIPGVGHNAQLMYGSEAVKAVLLNW